MFRYYTIEVIVYCRTTRSSYCLSVPPRQNEDLFSFGFLIAYKIRL